MSRRALGVVLAVPVLPTHGVALGASRMTLSDPDIPPVGLSGEPESIRATRTSRVFQWLLGLARIDRSLGCGACRRDGLISLPVQSLLHLSCPERRLLPRSLCSPSGVACGLGRQGHRWMLPG